MKNLLPALALSISLLASCSKKEDPQGNAPVAPAASGVSYMLDSRQMTGTGTIKLGPAGTNGSTNTDYLYVNTRAQATTGAYEYIHLVYTKSAGRPDAEYKAISIYIDVANAASYYYNTPLAGTLTKTTAGNWSGTFSGTRVSPQGAALSKVTAGVFTELAQ